MALSPEGVPARYHIFQEFTPSLLTVGYARDRLVSQAVLADSRGPVLIVCLKTRLALPRESMMRSSIKSCFAPPIFSAPQARLELNAIKPVMRVRNRLGNIWFCFFAVTYLNVFANYWSATDVQSNALAANWRSRHLATVGCITVSRRKAHLVKTEVALEIVEKTPRRFTTFGGSTRSERNQSRSRRNVWETGTQIGKRS